MNTTIGAVPTVVTGSIGVSYALNLWAPAWFIAIWLVVFWIAIGQALILMATRRNPLAAEVAIGVIGALFATLPLSIVAWSGPVELRWMCAAICAVYVGTESALMTYQPIRHWWIGPSLTIPAVAYMFVDAGQVGFAILYPLALVAMVGALTQSGRFIGSMRRRHAQVTDDLGQAEYLASHDQLTGVLNRRGVTQHLSDLRGQEQTVALIDVNRFKQINDSMGYLAGDAVLETIVETMRERLGDLGVIGRLGGDEFIVMVNGLGGLDDSVFEPVQCELAPGTLTAVTLSVGVFEVTAQMTVESIIKRTSFAVRAAKRTHGVVRFDNKLRAEYAKQNAIIESLRRVFADGKIVPYGQPIVRVDATGRPNIVGIELLARMKRSSSIVAPDRFLAALVASGLGPELSRLMVTEAVALARRLDGPDGGPYIAVNLSAADIESRELVDYVGNALREAGVPADRLMIEITEKERFAEGSDWRDHLARLRDLGVKIAIDDFGAGYSNVSRVHHLPITHLKIDRGMTYQAGTSLASVLAGIVEWGQQAGIQIIGEGVETDGMRDVLIGLGIGTQQGFLFARPDTLDRVEQLWETGLETAGELTST